MKQMIALVIICFIIVGGWAVGSAIENGPEPSKKQTLDCCGSNTPGGSGASGGCGSGGGCGSSGGSGLSPTELASNYYIQQTGDTDFTVKINDFGCHQEAEIIKNGVVIMELSISGGEVSEI